jgi:hypothetical protein
MIIIMNIDFRIYCTFYIHTHKISPCEEGAILLYRKPKAPSSQGTFFHKKTTGHCNFSWGLLL